MERIEGQSPEQSRQSIQAEKLSEVKEHLGEVFSSESLKIDSDKLQAFLAATGDTNPIHFDESKAKESVLADSSGGEILVPGFLTLSMCANEKVLNEALKISEPHEVISMKVDDVKFVAPVPVNASVSYEYKLKSVEDLKVKSKPAIKVVFDITAFVDLGNEKKMCMKAGWTLGYVEK